MAGKFVTIEGRPVFIGGPGGGAGSAGPGAGEMSLLDKLQHNEFSISHEKNYEEGLMESHLVSIDGDGLGIMKPDDEGYLELGLSTASAEAAAYDVAVAMGYEDLVPPTVSRDHEGRRISIQAWEDYAESAMESPDWLEDVPASDLKRMWILDAVIGNPDRHGNNILLLDREGWGKPRIAAIDNGMAFGLASNDCREFKPQVRPGLLSSLKFTVADFEPVRQLLENKQAMLSVERLIGSDALGTLRSRADALLTLGRAALIAEGGE